MNEKYRNLKNKLESIHRDLKGLKNYQDSLKDALNNNILFDGVNPVKDNLSSIKTNINSVDSKIMYTILPKVREKMNK